MPQQLPPPSPLSYQLPDEITERDRRRMVMTGALLGMQAAQGYYQQQSGMPPTPPAPSALAPTGGPVAAPSPVGASSGGVPVPPGMSALAAPLSGPAPMAPPMGPPSMMPPSGMPQPGGTPLGGGMPMPMARGGQLPTLPPDKLAQLLTPPPAQSAPIGGPAGIPQGPGIAPGPAGPPPGIDGLIGGQDLFNMAKSHFDAHGGPGAPSALAPPTPPTGLDPSEAPEYGPAPAAFVAWLHQSAAQSGDQLSQELAQLYQQNPQSVDELWGLVQELIAMGSPEVPPELAGLAQSAPTPAGSAPPDAGMLRPSGALGAQPTPQPL